MKLIKTVTNDQRYHNPAFKAYHKNWDEVKDNPFSLTYELDDGTVLRKVYNLDGTLHSIIYEFGEYDWLKQKKEIEDKFYSLQYLTEEELKFLDTCKNSYKVSGSDKLEVHWC